MKWSGGPQPTRSTIDIDSIPVVVQPQAQKLLALLDTDACWVSSPLAYAATQPRGFEPASFEPLAAMGGEGPKSFDRAGWLTALTMLGDRYPDIPCVLWDTIAIMGLRPSPHVEERIPELGTLLRHDWGISDAALHAAAKATALWSDICYTLAKYSGCYAEHGCGCSHITRALQSGASFQPMPEDRKEHVVREFWEHFLSELALIYVLGFPFALNEDTAQYSGTLCAEPALA